MYYFVPRMIKFYLGEDPILPNVETYLSSEEKDRSTSSTTWTSWWSKPPTRAAVTGCSSARRPARRRSKSSANLIEANPRNYIAQPVISLSRSPRTCDGTAGRPPHRPAALYSLRRESHHHAGRPDARGVEERLAGGQLLAGRREQGHLGAGGVIICNWYQTTIYDRRNSGSGYRFCGSRIRIRAFFHRNEQRRVEIPKWPAGTTPNFIYPSGNRVRHCLV